MKKAYILLLASLILFQGICFAQWWKFGKKKAIPEIVRLYIGKIDARDIDEQVTITTADLEHGLVYIKGKARVRRGKIAKVKISLDGGRSWKDVKVKEGEFMYKFEPKIGMHYDFQIYAIDTTGRKSDPHDYEFRIYVRPEIAKEQIKKTFNEMLQAYMREDIAGFMRYVSEDFQGDISILEDALEKDFRYFDNIKIYVSFSRITKRGKYYDVCFRYHRQVTSAKTGRILKDNSTSCASFELKENQIKLAKLMAPLIFGVSEPEDVATTVSQDAVGTEVLNVDEQGNVDIVEQKETVEKTKEEAEEEELPVYESVCLSGTEAFDFDTQTKIEGAGGADILPHLQGIMFFGSAPHGIRKMSQDFESIKSCPTSGYQGEVWNVMPGDVYCIWTDGGTYAKIRITSFSEIPQEACFDYAVSKKNVFK